MSRAHISFFCESSILLGTIDHAPSATGLLIVSGGNETRGGAWAGQAQLAAKLAISGFPVMRFDRRGVGDSDGPNGGFRTSAPDIVAALAAFRAQCPALTHIIGMGNCDGASALMLAKGEGFDGLILSNPWTIEQPDTAPASEAIRAHYRQRLASPEALKRLLSGKVSLGSLFISLKNALKPAPPPSSLAQDMAAGIADFSGPITILIAQRDRTAQAFLSGWNKADPRIRRCAGASHSFVEADAREWLETEVLRVLEA